MPCTKSERPLWALVDCNNFYASCERLFRPDLMGQPIVVLSNNDGCIVARSNEAKALGIPMGEPEYKARALLRAHKVQVFSSNYALYGDISQRVMATLESLCPAVEQYSIDEAFVRLDGALRIQSADWARALRARTGQWTGITVSVGVGSTRTLAKLANHLAKKQGGVCILPQDSAALDALLARIPVGEVWGVGRHTVTKLHAAGIHSALDLKNANDLWVRKQLTVAGWRTVLELRGLPCLGQDTAPLPRRTLVSSRSFGERVYTHGELAEALSTFAARAGQRLRRLELVAGGLAVHIRTARQGKNLYDQTAHVALPGGTADSLELIRAAQRGLESIFQEGPAYAKAGIMLFHLESAHCCQGSLLALAAQKDKTEDKRRTALMRALDCARERYGSRALCYGAEGPREAAWHMRQKHCSPRMTTVWGELPVARCM